MARDDENRRSKPADAIAPEGDAAASGDSSDDDTEGHSFLPDRSGQYLGAARERDIRQHLSRRELENAAKKDKRR